jgi:hypothetical protein
MDNNGQEYPRSRPTWRRRVGPCRGMSSRSSRIILSAAGSSRVSYGCAARPVMPSTRSPSAANAGACAPAAVPGARADDCREAGGRATQDAKADDCREAGGRATQDAKADDCREAGGRATQDAKAGSTQVVRRWTALNPPSVAQRFGFRGTPARLSIAGRSPAGSDVKSLPA